MLNISLTNTHVFYFYIADSSRTLNTDISILQGEIPGEIGLYTCEYLHWKNDLTSTYSNALAEKQNVLSTITLQPR